MPHIVIQYTPNIDADMDALCRDLADVIVTQKDEGGALLYPTGGTRVMAYPAAHYAVADGKRDYAFVYVNVRIAAGRSDSAKKATGDALTAAVKARFATLFEQQLMGITLQVDESPGQVYDAKHSNLHPLFQK
ncbi:5-carboxymethyl-2-hydroxymuconate isomerase [Caenimonas aquaedulcis]|uniref:5-carboxymethyl-2-hydroxymuconate isomerase n=1 Tax=Caenimonas aquaedulcis TaxID=2793270 RepID=A0A931H640_9BURK|nr:5-carboxymethyl-2-hydroxymuconate isomerase [Caenimonas aquaedulcis]MBG9389157.1 5-carboxymethyl-2-hydroxymuconate isomerase [Caenimonas aquaedulcis]